MSELSTCKHPLKGFYTFFQNPIYTDVKQNKDGSITTSKPKLRSDRKIKVTSYDVDHLELINNRLVYKYDENISPDANAVYKEYQEIPCGRCIACRLKRSREWADRCMLELPYHKHSYFVTLTYDDEHLPYGDVVPENGFLTENPTLVKKDLQKFFKRLRKNYKHDNKIKYYACGEYGDRTKRPHYHAIIFGLELDDLQVYRQSPLGFNYYISSWLNSVWSLGYVIIADVSWETCAYTARYILKKQLGKTADLYDSLGILSEFNVMSLKPGIGLDFFNDNVKNIYELDSIYLSTNKGGRKIKPPKYYDRKFAEDLDNAFILEEIRKVRRESAERKKKLMMDQTDNTYLDILQIEEDLLNQRLSLLKRKEI